MATWDNSANIRQRARTRLRNEAGPCWICGLDIDYTLPSPDPGSFELDHVLPKDTHPELAFEASNHRASHRSCNRAKSNKPHANILRRSGSLA